VCLLRGRIEFLDIFHVDFRPQGRCAMAQVISCRPRNAKARVRLQVSPRKICFGQSDTKRGSAPSTSVSPDSIIPPMPHTHSFIYHRLYTVFLQVLQFPLSVSFHQCPILIHSSTTDSVYCFSRSTLVSPVSFILPTPHTHSFIYHRLCILFFSQYFSFPCQYHSTNAPHSFIHLPQTLYNVFLPVLQFPLSISFNQCPILIHSSTTYAV